MIKLILVFIFSVQLLSGQNQGSPNIIIFLSDDHGAEDAGCYGNPDLQTPVIDQMAREGMIFRRAYAPVSVCAPSRSSLFTGLYPHKNGCDRNHGKVLPGIKPLPEYLKPLGYRVALAGKKHIQPEAQFDFEYLELHQVADFLGDVGDDPFCLIISMHAPHQPYFNHKGGYGRITPKSWLPDTKATRQYTAAYYDHVNILDHELGTYLYWVEKYGYSDALQIYASDHGPAFPFAKWSLYEQGIRIPLIVKWPGVISAGSQSQELVSLVDVLPTLVMAAGGQEPGSLDGRNLSPVFKNESLPHRNFIYAAYTNQGVQGANEYPIRAIVSHDMKVIVNLHSANEFHIDRMDTPDPRSLINSYDVLRSWLEDGSEIIRQRARQHWKRPAVELYDLKKDPGELVNLAGLPEYYTTILSMVGQLERWMVEQNDPEIETIRKILNEQNDRNK